MIKMFQYEPGKVREVLESLAYHPIQEMGKYLRTKALYRQGGNPTSLSVNKETGWCKDFVDDSTFSLSELVSKTLQTRDPKIIAKYVSGKILVEKTKERPKINMPRTYDPKDLSRLFPNYEFYKRRGISVDTQAKYQLGLAQSGQMLRRFVFPVWDEFGQIVGFSGRSLDWKEDSSFPKWKHIGQKNSWIYPFYLPKLKECQEKIEESATIFIVESIGDSLAMTEHGMENHIVDFGLSCSPAVQAFLLSKDPEKIVISKNNDFNSVNQKGEPENHGQIAAIKTMAKLSAIFPIERLTIKLPTLNDLGDMHQSGADIKKWSWSEKDGGGKEISRAEIKDFVDKNREYFKTLNMEKFLKKL